MQYQCTAACVSKLTGYMQRLTCCPSLLRPLNKQALTGTNPPCPAAALGPIKVVEGVEAPTLLAEALWHTITHDAADLQGESVTHNTTAHSRRTVRQSQVITDMESDP